MNRGALLNIALLARSGYDPKTMDPTATCYSALEQIATVNYQQVKDNEISISLCNIHHCAPVRLMLIAERATDLLRRSKPMREEES